MKSGVGFSKTYLILSLGSSEYDPANVCSVVVENFEIFETDDALELRHLNQQFCRENDLGYHKKIKNFTSPQLII